MATKRSAKGTKAPARKQKRAPKSPKRTMIKKTMTPQPETEESANNIGPITLAGTFDDAAFPYPWTMEPQKELTISASRKFLWLEVHRQRVKQTVRIQAHTVTQAPDGAITYSVPMKVDGPCETILSPWWERALYAVARIWS